MPSRTWRDVNLRCLYRFSARLLPNTHFQDCLATRKKRYLTAITSSLQRASPRQRRVPHDEAAIGSGFVAGAFVAAFFRVTTITDLLEQDVPLDVQRMAAHADPRTTRLYDRRDKKVTRNIVERISI